MSELISRTADRKEIFDYLRNLQKAEEISAKRSGISIWVLWGALWFITWKLAENIDFLFSPKFLESTLSIILISQVFSTLFTPAEVRDTEDTPRYLNYKIFSSSETPSLLIVSMIWALVPTATFTYLFGFSLLSLYVGWSIFGLLFFVIWLEFSKEKTRFPKPTFRTQSSRKSRFFFSILIIAVCILDSIHLTKNLPPINMSMGKTAILVLTLYWLIYILFDSLLKRHNDTWTYRIEQELLLGSISSEEALRKIEQRYLGAKLSEVIEDYWHNIAIQTSNARKLLDEFMQESIEISKIPTEYSEERKSRIEKVVKPINKAFSKLLSDHSEFATYTHEIIDSQKFSTNSNIIEAIKNSLKQNEQSSSELNLMINTFKSEGEKLGVKL